MKRPQPGWRALACLNKKFGHWRVHHMSRSWLVAACAAFVVIVGGRISAAAEPMEVETSYYLGESKMTTPDGKLIRTSVSLVKRLVNKKESRIEEYVLTVSEKDSKAFVATLTVKGSKFTVSEKSESFTGEGE